MHKAAKGRKLKNKFKGGKIEKRNFEVKFSEISIILMFSLIIKELTIQIKKKSRTLLVFIDFRAYNFNFFQRSIISVCFDCSHSLDDVHSIVDSAENSMLSIEMLKYF